MLITCSRCGSETVRTSRSRSLSGKFLNLLGIAAFRCQNCDYRFRASIWGIRQAFYAKCPRCHRMDLSKWNTDHYHPPLGTRIAVACAAKAVRCEYCRHNFWSFRRVKVVFSLLKRYARSPIVFDSSDGEFPPELPAIKTQDHPIIGDGPELAVRSGS